MATHSYECRAQPNATDTIDVSIETFYGAELVVIELSHDPARLTADQALELAADLVAHANQLREPSDEDKIRDAMAEAQEHPGRMVTR